MTGEPQHHGRPMYRDEHDGRDMLRWLCTEPGCSAALSDGDLSTMREMLWAADNGIQLPGVTIIGGESGG